MLELLPQPEEEVEEEEFQRFRVHERALERVPGREMCEEFSDAVEAPPGILDYGIGMGGRDGGAGCWCRGIDVGSY